VEKPLTCPNDPSHSILPLHTAITACQPVETAPPQVSEVTTQTAILSFAGQLGGRFRVGSIWHRCGGFRVPFNATFTKLTVVTSIRTTFWMRLYGGSSGATYAELECSATENTLNTFLLPRQSLVDPAEVVECQVAAAPGAGTVEVHLDMISLEWK
jgi:hypothetical protein